MFVYMDDLAALAQVSIATGRGGAILARQVVGAGVGRGPVPLSTLQRESLQRQRDLYLSPIERQRREEAEIRRQQAAQRATYGTRVRETTGSRTAAGAPVDAEVLRQQHAQRDEMTKRGVAVKDTPGSQAAAWGTQTRTRSAPAPTTPAPAPAPPATGPRPAAPFRPDYVTAFVNTRRPAATGASSWETSQEWLERYDPERAVQRAAAEARQREVAARFAERQTQKPLHAPPPRASAPQQPPTPRPAPQTRSRTSSAGRSSAANASGSVAKPAVKFKGPTAPFVQFAAEWENLFSV